MNKIHTGRPGALLGLLLVGALSGCATMGGPPPADPVAEAAKEAPLEPLALPPEEFMRVATGIYVVVDLDTNMLRVVDSGRTLWEAPVGTGTGLRLKGEDGEWHFSTPVGVFPIQYKEELPVWYLPDWYFVEKGLPIPPDDAPQRKVEGQLGVAAVYLGEEIAIHGTDRPELLGQRVSHGCIRLENKFAQRLYHNVQVGTPVVVIGGEHLEDVPPGPTTDPGRRPAARPRDPLAGVGTEELLTRLSRELERGDTTGAWVPLASRLITRGLKDDAIALRGLLERANTARREGLNREYATFLADAYARGSMRAVVSLARIAEAPRRRAADAIVHATMALHAGTLEDPRAPWPTRRLPDVLLGPEGSTGWRALREAEERYRSTTTGGGATR